MDDRGGARARGGRAGEGGVKAAPETWDPQRRVFAAIEQSRGALGQVEPLSEMERAQIRDCLARVGVPAKAAGVVE